jgi:hypothetical protein
MLSVIGNGRMGSIKKQIFVSALLFSCSQLGAMCCPQAVGPLSISEGILNLLLRVADAQTMIQSQIGAIDCNVTVTTLVVTNTVSGCVCDCLQFGQSDIGTGGTYTINSPGVYCMYQTANWSSGAAITVNSSNVTLDMQNHTLNGGSSGATGIVINGGLSNVTIKNGNITNPTSACITKGGADVLLQNIIIQNMNFTVLNVAASYPAVSMQGGAADTQFYNVLIENCTGYNTYIILNPGLSAIVRGCRFTCNGFGASSTGNASITIQGISSGSPIFGQSVLIEDCSLSNDNPTTYPTNNASFSVSWMETAVIRNCVSSGSGNDAFTVSDGVNAALYNCVAQQSAGNGFLFQPGSTTAMNISATSCFAQGCIHGFWVKNFAGDSGCKSVVLTNCVAQNSAQNGFYVTNTETASNIIIPITFRGCDSNGNGGNGFEIGITGFSPVGYGELYDCIAANNTFEGFALGGDVTALKIEHCWSVHNGDVGFYDASGAGPNFYWGNRSFNNPGGGYVPSAIPNQSQYTANIISYGLNIYSPS